jgi:hypothetical protein
LARKLSEVQDVDFVHIAQEGSFLLLCAIIADLCGIETGRVATALIHQPTHKILPLLGRAAGLEAQPMALAALALRQVRDSMSDEAIGAMVEGYDALTPLEAHSALVRLSLSDGLQAALRQINAVEDA